MLWVCDSVCNGAAVGCATNKKYRTIAFTLELSVYFELCCFVVGVFSFQSTQLSGFVLNGKVTVVLKGTSAIV